MSEAFYNRMAATADRLLKKFGQPRTIKLLVPPADDGSGDPWDPNRPGSDTEYTLSGIVIQPRQDGVEGNTLVSDKQRRVKASNFQANGTKLPVTPAIGHSLSFDGHTWKITNVGGSNPGGVQLLWELEVER